MRLIALIAFETVLVLPPGFAVLLLCAVWRRRSMSG